MIQIKIPPALPPSNSERPSVSPSEESGFEDILQARVAASPTVAAPSPTSKVEDGGTEATDDSDLAEAESLSATSVATPPGETPQSAPDRDVSPLELEELLPVGEDGESAVNAEITPAIVAEPGDGRADDGAASGARLDGAPTDGLRRSADGVAAIRPSVGAPNSISPSPPPPQDGLPLKEDALPASEIPEEAEGAPPEPSDVDASSAPPTGPRALRTGVKDEGQGRVGNSAGRESKAAGSPESPFGGSQENASDSSGDPSSSRDKRASRPAAGVEPAAFARPTGQPSTPPSQAAAQPSWDASAPSTIEAGGGSSTESRAEALIEQVRVHVKPGQSRIAFRLDPPRLGRLSIRLVMRGGRLLGQVRTETQEAAHLLRSGIEGLRGTLREAGIHVDRLEFQPAPPASSDATQEGLPDGSGRQTDWGDAPGGSQHRSRGPRGEIRIARAVLEMDNESDDGRLDVVA